MATTTTIATTNPIVNMNHIVPTTATMTATAATATDVVRFCMKVGQIGYYCPEEARKKINFCNKQNKIIYFVRLLSCRRDNVWRIITIRGHFLFGSKFRTSEMPDQETDRGVLVKLVFAFAFPDNSTIMVSTPNDPEAKWLGERYWKMSRSFTRSSRCGT